MSSRKLKIVFWGTYDLGKPRVRLLVAGARACSDQAEITECRATIWKGVEDKSLLGIPSLIRRLLLCLISYPRLIAQYLLLPRHDVVVIAYFGHLDALILWPFAKLRGVPVVWDIFIPLYEAVVEDRKILTPKSFFARLLYAWEWLASRAVSGMFLDTSAHASYFESTYRLPDHSIDRVFVGAEPLFRTEPDLPPKVRNDRFEVLFYGQFIPCHGTQVIIDAAAEIEAQHQNVHWTIIGSGQNADEFDTRLAESGLRTVTRIPWVDYEQLAAHIRGADVCLGIFGTTSKASRVIPNKVFQVLSCAQLLITSDSPAVRELIRPGPFVKLIPPGNPRALAAAVIEFRDAQPTTRIIEPPTSFGERNVGAQLIEVLERYVEVYSQKRRSSWHR